MKEEKRTSDNAPLKDIVDKFMKAYQLDSKMKELDIIAAWPDMMGIAVANRTKEIKIKNMVLIVKMDSAVMRDELSYGKTIIIDRVNEKAGFEMISDVWFT